MDLKSKAIAPASLTKTSSAFANADGGELYIGIEDKARSRRDHWRGFGKSEEANGHVQALEEFFPLGTYFKYQFLSCDGLPGLLFHCEILKTPDVRPASDGRAYLRRGAQNLPQTTPAQLERLGSIKGCSATGQGGSAARHAESHSSNIVLMNCAGAFQNSRMIRKCFVSSPRHAQRRRIAIERHPYFACAWIALQSNFLASPIASSSSMPL